MRFGPNIITEGLVFFADAANPTSYISGSSTVDSLVDDTIGSLINYTDFSTDNQGTWVFDGIDDRLEINKITSINPLLLNSSFNIWVHPSETGYQWCFSKSGVYYPIYGLRYHAPGSPGPSGNPTPSKCYSILAAKASTRRLQIYTTGTDFNEEWTNVCVTKADGGNALNNYNIKIYVNGINQNLIIGENTSLSQDDMWLDNNLDINMFNLASLYRAPAHENYTETKISFFSIYGKTLTDDEVLHNYNALKGRFGLS
tara:strand:- start:4 stop:774 length:771 start_codon:yes stop_codon:yes gene_type:complete